MNIAIIDIVFMGIVAVSALRCAARGFVSELLSMAALIIGLFSAIFFFRRGAVFVRESVMPGTGVLPEIIAFIVIFLTVFAVIKIIEIMLKTIIEGIHLGGLDHLLGFAFGFAEGIVIVCLFLFLISVQPFIDHNLILGKSFFAEVLLPFIVGDKKEILESIVWIQAPSGGY